MTTKKKNAHNACSSSHKSIIYYFADNRLQVGLHGGKYVFGGYSIGCYRIGGNAV
jgi:hypothetical protein